MPVLKNDAPPPAATVKRRWALAFFIGWTVFAALATMWLARRSPAAGFGWSSDASGRVPLWQRAGNWLRLADLSLRGAYPWALFAPYILWLGARFRLEKARWASSAVIHILACALFVLASEALTQSARNPMRVIVTYGRTATNSAEGKTIIATRNTVTFTNDFEASLAPPRDFPLPPPGAGGVGVDRAGRMAGNMFRVREGRMLPALPQLLSLLVYACLVGLAHAVHFYGRFRERERCAEALEAQLTKARLSALQAQLHPHFLFNALNAISTLMQRDPPAAQDALASFSELLRLALSQANRPEAPLRQDLEFLRRYVQIQQMRLGERLRFEERIDPAALDCLAPALLLQPLVENAIRHGIEPSSATGLVRVTAAAENAKLVLTVEDNGAGPGAALERPNGGAGIGLDNLRARLESLYGRNQRIDFGPRAEGGARVRVELPLRRPELESR